MGDLEMLSCPDDKPYMCPPYGMCYTYNQFCDPDTRTVESCFPSSLDALDFCRQYVKGKVEALHPSCHMACQFNFTASDLNPEDCPNTWFLLFLIFGALFLLSFVVNSVFIAKSIRRCRANGYQQVKPDREEGDEKDGTMKELKELVVNIDEEPADKNHVQDAPAIDISGNRQSAELNRPQEIDSQLGRETQPGSNSNTPASASGSQDMLNDEDNMGATLRESADGNASSQGSPQISNRSGSSSSTSIASQSSGAQASGGEREPHPAEIEGEENRRRHFPETNTHKHDKDKHKLVTTLASHDNE